MANISKGQHGAGSQLAVPSYPPWSALLIATDAHSQHTDNSSSRAYPQSISQQLPHAQKVASLPAAPCAEQGSADRTGRIHKVKWKNLSFASIMVLVARRCRLVLTLFPLVVETKGQLLHLTKTILHIYIYTWVRDKFSMKKVPTALFFPHTPAVPLACYQRSSML